MPVPSKVIWSLSIVLALVGRTSAQNASEKLAYFENHVRPLLVKHCFECHNDKKQEGGIRLDHRDGMIAGGDSGTAVVAGKPEESLLIEAVRYDGLEMPPDEPLSDEDVAKLVRWVREGALWPDEDKVTKPSLGDQEAIRQAADSHWAFQPITPSKPPETSDPDWAKHPVDRFVLAKLESNGLSPSSRAPRDTLIRRAFIDLIGLPPTPEVVSAVFGQSDLRDKTFEEILNGLLASQHYGERMARHWMDVARYADTRDFQAAADLRYPFAFTYRDWLINAFNQDLPFDQFVRYQMAADHLVDRDDSPDLAALGFLTVGPLFRNNALERASDRIDVVTRGLMGLTGSCARCHDHKYDPISIEDYYSLYGVFRDSIRPSDFPTIENPLGSAVPSELVREFENALEAEKQKLRDYENSLAQSASVAFRQRPSEYLLSYVELSIEKSETTRGLKSKRKLEETALTPIANNLDAFRRNKRQAKHPILGPLVGLIAVPDDAFEKQRTVYLKLHEKTLHPMVAAAVRGSDSRRDLAERYGDVLKTATTSDDDSLAEIRSLVVNPDEGPFAIAPKAASNASRLLGKGRQTLLKFQQAIADVEATHPGAPDKAMILEDAKQSRPVFVMFRGEAARRGPEVPKRFPDYFAGANDKPFENGSGRLDLAERIVSDDNPLAARVIVNRVWRMHFGKGLVEDAGDFGLRSAPPAQLELMNWLAWTLRKNGWSIKWLHKTIMMSNTYRQASSAMSPPMRDDGTSAAEIDSTNQLLWRQNRRRLDFESMRDSMLAVAGTLDPTIGGRSVKLSETPHPTRRSVYAYVDRVDPDPLFATFDVPSASVCSAQRTETLVPQQALFAMNNPFVTDQARALIARADFQSAKTRAEKIELLFQRTVQRKPRPNEVAMVSRFVDQASKTTRQSNQVWHYGYGSAVGAQASFQPLKHFSGQRYAAQREIPSQSHGFLQLTRVGGHPGRNSDQSSIRRWIAPDSMLIRIAGTLEHKSDRGDGIRAIVRVNGQQVFERTVKTGSEKSVAGYHQVDQGDTVDFIVDPQQTTTSDGYRWTVLIEQRDESKKNVLDTWRSGQDFSGPPPPVMTPWEQTAQAMMMTNEFLFID